ncbi:hypothetical protein BWI93_18780 [Siphonobacter sp. BAB-5385]|uniref:DUF6660 family protein n=1 Tax=Siphonobacter sp. BAB-5385 TaxID=1864822 RepID=UPI000B9EDB37|nr:DUF6660 family protein [Siphonobacter sp. BAB-5385]OZI06695.1 hypothetical protein BWI93_18780 [Siphonobacter sp. BAB-5385]
MRILALFLALYTLILSVAPCTEHHHVRTASTTTQVSIQTQDHDEDSHEHALCSPFCVCHCTGGFVATLLTVPEFTSTSLSLSPDKPSFWYILAQPQGYAFSIWQPPLQA